MKNVEAVTKLCNAICSSFYPDSAAVEMVLFTYGIDAEAEAKPKDKDSFRAAVSLVKGYVEGSRSEGGFSVSVLTESVKNSIMFWCGVYDVPVDEFLDSVKTIEDGSSIW